MVIDVNGIQLHYETYGHGTPLLWLHGFMGSGADWRYIFKEPPPSYRLIAPDMRGHGASTPSPNTYSHRQCADDVLALLDHLQIHRIKAIGISGGGITLLHMATRAPARVEAMVLVSAPHYFPPQARTFQRQFSEAMMTDLERRLLRERHQHGEAQIQWLIAQCRAFADSYDDVNFTALDLSKITAETLLVFGDRDPLYPVSLATELHAAIPQSYLWVIPNGGHGPVFRNAAPLFAETTRSFLSGEWRPSSSEIR
jgi:pimeloyl-ACP methyl ester carboxylesterase